MRSNFIEYAEFTDHKSLYFIDKHGYLELHDEIKGFLGNFEIWHDSENENKEYINLNNNKVYIETIAER
jgi:hypothetical protein